MEIESQNLCGSGAGQGSYNSAFPSIKISMNHYTNIFVKQESLQSKSNRDSPVDMREKPMSRRSLTRRQSSGVALEKTLRSSKTKISPTKTMNFGNLVKQQSRDRKNLGTSELDSNQKDNNNNHSRSNRYRERRRRQGSTYKGRRPERSQERRRNATPTPPSDPRKTRRTSKASTSTSERLEYSKSRVFRHRRAARALTYTKNSDAKTVHHKDQQSHEHAGK